MDYKEILRAAIKVLQENEWGQWTAYREERGKHYFCATGALWEGICPGSWRVGRFEPVPTEVLSAHAEAYTALARAARKRVPECTGAIHYNDRFANSKEDIISLFEEAING